MHFMWISGKRMISQGTDGLSRGDLLSGVMQGEEFLKFLPFNKTALERQKDLRNRITRWLKHPGNWIFTNTEDWFDVVFLDPNRRWIWTPPPCLARLTVEQLCEVKHIFPDSQHVFICPALMTGYWQKFLGKVVDTMFTFKAGCCLWPESMYELSLLLL